MATGVDPTSIKPEIIDLTDESFKCSVSQYPKRVETATGGLVGNTPLICGGFIFDNNSREKSCYSLKEDGGWKLEAYSELNAARSSAANGNVILNNQLVIAGGSNGTNLDTIEVVAPNTKSKTLSVRLPVAMFGSCIVPWDTDTFLIIGGQYATSRKQTYFINMANNTYTAGPDLLTGRVFFACNTMNVNGEDFIIVAGGFPAQKSTEYLPKANIASGWQKSKNWTVV